MPWADWIGPEVVGGVLLAVVTWFLGRRKTKADVEQTKTKTDATAIKSAQTLVDVAMSMRSEVSGELGKVREQLNTTHNKLTAHIEADLRWQKQDAEVVAMHHEWDRSFVAEARRKGMHVEDPPPLRAPRPEVAVQV